MRKLGTGFTIVELLIVIVVIAILAAISVVAYNGIQDRSKNSKMVTAVSQYAKAITLYYQDKGTLPGVSCLGPSSDYPPSPLMAQDICGNSSGWDINPALATQLSDYMKTLPTVDASLIINNSDNSLYRRGAMYGLSGGIPGIWFTYIGSTCPTVSGLGPLANTFTDSDSGTVHCRGFITGASQ